jgi:four helix bundle protein
MPLDLNLRTKAFAVRIIEMYSKLSRTDAVAQVLGKQVLRSGTSVGANSGKHPAAGPNQSSFPKWAIA